MTCQTSTRPKN